MKYKKSTGVAALGLSAGLLLSSCASGESAPAPKTPNGSLSRVAYNLGYQQTLDQIRLHQTLRIRLPRLLGEKVTERLNIWNFTEANINQAKVTDVANFLMQIIAVSPRKWNFTIDYSQHHPHMPINAFTMANGNNEHDMLLVPGNAPDPPYPFGDGGVSTTEDLSVQNPKISQSISVVYRPQNDSGAEGSFLGENSGLPTEMCQSLISAIPDVSTLGPSIDVSEVSHLTQETVCNSIGDTAIAALDGESYSAYASNQKMNQGTVSDSLGESWLITDFTVPPDIYKTLQEKIAA